MTENTYYKPRLIIGKKEILIGMSGNISFPGNNQSNSMSCTIKDPDFQNHRLFNEEVSFYLNYGSDDGVPIFRGYIKDVQPNDKVTNITAVDGRTFINSQNSKLVELTEEDNYDGYTLAAFLYDYIDNNVNIPRTYIGLDMLTDTYPPISLSNVRNEPTPAYQIVTNKLMEAIDDTNIEEPLNFFIDMIDDGVNSHITFVKNKSLTSAPSLSLSFGRGLKRYKYNRRAPANYATAQGAKFTYGTAPMGSVGMRVGGKFKDRNEARQQLIKEVLLQYQYIDQITVEVTKGHYIGLGSIIEINLENEELFHNIEMGHRNHRVSSKNIKYSETDVTLTLSLNKLHDKLSDISPFLQ